MHFGALWGQYNAGRISVPGEVRWVSGQRGLALSGQALDVDSLPGTDRASSWSR